ncbi:MAG: type II toxin-antitoxin system RelE/ParE family toxin [Isosphaerales bacterium]
MNEPKLTDQAKVDLREIWYSIASDRDQRTADRVVTQIFDKCHNHAQFPESGRLREELSRGLRSFPVRPYVVFYSPFEDTILVLRILHGRRDLTRVQFEE